MFLGLRKHNILLIIWRNIIFNLLIKTSQLLSVIILGFCFYYFIWLMFPWVYHRVPHNLFLIGGNLPFYGGFELRQADSWVNTIGKVEMLARIKMWTRTLSRVTPSPPMGSNPEPLWSMPRALPQGRLGVFLLLWDLWWKNAADNSAIKPHLKIKITSLIIKFYFYSID